MAQLAAALALLHDDLRSHPSICMKAHRCHTHCSSNTIRAETGGSPMLSGPMSVPSSVKKSVSKTMSEVTKQDTQYPSSACRHEA